MIAGILSCMKERYFRNAKDTERHRNRVTLFRCVESEEESGRVKCLTVFARAGRYEDSTRAWALDDNEPERCRGAAGQIWFHGTDQIFSAICDWPGDDDPDRDDKKRRYAQGLKITLAEAESLHVKSKVFVGLRVVVRNRIWGVLLLDSMDDGQITANQHDRTLLEQYGRIINMTLEGIES